MGGNREGDNIPLPCLTYSDRELESEELGRAEATPAPLLRQSPFSLLPCLLQQKRPVLCLAGQGITSVLSEFALAARGRVKTPVNC